jgi:proteic killer suppression protein
MIVTFRDKATEDLHNGHQSKASRRFPPDLVRVALRKLDMLDAAREIKDLRSPPGNRLEPLRGDYLGFWSIRVNQQWRLVFQWTNGDAYEVHITDYHTG